MLCHFRKRNSAVMQKNYPHFLRKKNYKGCKPLPEQPEHTWKQQVQREKFSEHFQKSHSAKTEKETIGARKKVF